MPAKKDESVEEGGLLSARKHGAQQARQGQEGYLAVATSARIPSDTSSAVSNQQSNQTNKIKDWWFGLCEHAGVNQDWSAHREWCREARIEIDPEWDATKGRRLDEQREHTHHCQNWRHQIRQLSHISLELRLETAYFPKQRQSQFAKTNRKVI